MNRVVMLLACGLSAFCVQTGFAANTGLSQLSPAVPHFGQVTSAIFRGGRPDAQGLTDLARMGVRTIIDLEDNQQAVAQETALATRLRMTVIPEPMSVSATPNDAEISQILSLMADSRRFPIYVHCEHGEDRTGLVVGLFRVKEQRVQPAEAFREMLANDFHPRFEALNNYFKAKTGLR